MIERLYYLLLMSGGKMIRRIRAAPSSLISAVGTLFSDGSQRGNASTLASAVGRLTRGAVSAAESITQTRVSAKGELVSQEYRYTAVAKMQIHAAAMATTAVETLEGAAKTVLAATAIATTAAETLKGAAKTGLAAVATATRAERKDISGQSNDGFGGRGRADSLDVTKLRTITASAFRAVGVASTESFASVAGRNGAAFAAKAAAKLVSVFTVSGFPQMAAAAIGNLAQVNAPASAAAAMATAAIGVLYNRSATALTGWADNAISARGRLFNSTNTLHGDGSTRAAANGQALLLTGRSAVSRTSTTVSAQGAAGAHATKRGRVDTEVSAAGQVTVNATQRSRTETEVSAAGQATVNATQRGRAGAVAAAIGAAVKTETSRSRPETLVLATASATIAQNAASDTETAVRVQGRLVTIIFRYVSATTSVAAEAVGNATATVGQLAGRGATAVLSVGQLMLQNFRSRVSTTVSAVGQLGLYPGQLLVGKTKTKVSAVGALTAVEVRTLQGGVKALVTAVARAFTSDTQRAFTGAMLSAQGTGTIFPGAGRCTAGTGVSATAEATLAATSRGTARSAFSATATAIHQVLLLTGSTSTAGSATSNASVSAWNYPIYNSETEDLYIRQTVSANQNGSRLTVT